MNFPDLLVATFNTHKKHFWLFTKLTLLFYFIPTSILSVMSMLPALKNIEPVDADILSQMSLLQQIELTGGNTLQGIIISIAQWIILLFVLIMIIRMLTVIRDKGTITAREGIQEGVHHFFRGLHLLVILGLFLIGLFLLLIVPGIIFMIYWIFAFFALLIERAQPMQALKQSKVLVKGRWWRVCFYILGSSFTVGIVSAVIGIFFWLGGIVLIFTVSMTSYIIYITIMQTLLTAVFLPFTFIFMEKFYYELKANPVTKPVTVISEKEAPG